MKRLIGIVCFFSLQINCIAQQPLSIMEKVINREWISLKGKCHYSDSILFEPKDVEIHLGLNETYDVYTFNEDSTIVYKVYNPEELFSCGVGSCSLDEGKWKITNSELSVHLVWRCYPYEEFTHRDSYSLILLAGNRLKLIRLNK